MVGVGVVCVVSVCAFSVGAIWAGAAAPADGCGF